MEAPSVSALQEYLKSDLFLPYWEELKVAYIDKELENSAESLQKLGRANAWKTIHEAILSGEAQGPRKYTRNRPNKADWNRIDHYARYFAQVKRDARASTDSFTAKSLVRFPRPWISRSTTVSGRPTCLCGSTTGHRERNVLLRGSWASESRPSDENAEFRAHQLRVAAAEKRQQCRNETEQRTDFERRLADAAAAESQLQAEAARANTLQDRVVQLSFRKALPGRRQGSRLHCGNRHQVWEMGELEWYHLCKQLWRRAGSGPSADGRRVCDHVARGWDIEGRDCREVEPARKDKECSLSSAPKYKVELAKWIRSAYSSISNTKHRA